MQPFTSSIFVLLIIPCLLRLVDAHAQVFEIAVDGIDQIYGVNTYIRSPPTNSPVKDLTSSAVACNVNNRPVPTTLTVRPGDTVTFIWGHDHMDDDIIALSHLGPIVVYIAPTSSEGAGNVWVKLAEDGYDGSQWAVQKLVANRGRHSVVLPDLEPGEYLLRPEIIALHEADAVYTEFPARGVQLYMECVQIKITVDTGSLSLPTGVSFPGAYKYTDPGIHFNLYNSDPNSYIIPGPPVWNPESSASSTTVSATISSTPASSTTNDVSSAMPTSPFSTVGAVTVTRVSTVTVSVSTATTKTVTVTAGAPASTVTVTDLMTTTIKTPAGSCQTNSPTGVDLYGQCGGINYSGETSCKVGTCKYLNDYYYQCLL
ncbi:carbohydrate-binding module family 1 protein [Lipomyces tetrasporus]|uniref:AA9 family lytic polysaccharide monooxygenase n=1 Tax=Lipomyces tetrasporus TaxID=54092 RepID=A0AAD7VUR2_9ASCO|nr:carbohydrate-binding module family 1 protein [Lipomyces tetrasporus]KAJ8102114.1 carbohydrate-binding module family 1 protein [Lipomyces tetrasporus]